MRRTVLIQAEAANDDQMAGIASVFYNRLNAPNQFPHLQTDPTILYVEEVIKPNSTVANQEMYDAYNTNVCNGLPVGPICNPGEAAIKAALKPETPIISILFTIPRPVKFTTPAPMQSIRPTVRSWGFRTRDEDENERLSRSACSGGGF